MAGKARARTEVKGWMQDLDDAMGQALADGNTGELRRIIDELEQMIAAARSNLEEIERGEKGTKGLMEWLRGLLGSNDAMRTNRILMDRFADVADTATRDRLIDEFEQLQEQRLEARRNGAEESELSALGDEQGRIIDELMALEGKSADGKPVAAHERSKGMPGAHLLYR